CFLLFFFFQAEDGIRDSSVTGVQTCALPISASTCGTLGVANGDAEAGLPAVVRFETPKVPHVDAAVPGEHPLAVKVQTFPPVRKIGRASCRERVKLWVSEDDLE